MERAKVSNKVSRAMLVYQGGIANVFSVASFNLADYGRDAQRIMQSDFHSCEMFTRGLARAGAIVMSAYCNEAGDIARSLWKDDHADEAPFWEQMNPVNSVNTYSFMSKA